ncbi:MAG: GNAT family N-acetyltransferase [Christensenellales bacterium]
MLYNSRKEFSLDLTDDISMTSCHTDNDRTYVCENLISHNIKHTSGLLKKPGLDINIYLKEKDKVIGAILCDTFNMSVYIDVLWVDEAYRGRGYGKALIAQAEEIAKGAGCVLSHTCTFNYQSPEFYKACGYEVFAELKDYPDGIVQYFLKKRL